MWLGALVYAIAFSVITVARHYSLHSFAWDLGLYSQGLFTTTHQGQFFYSTPDQPNNPGGSLFGVHFAPILIFLLPLYWAVPVPATLLVLQSVALASGAPIVFRLARSRSLPDSSAGVLAAVYLLNPALHGVNWFDFHPQALLIPFALAAVYAWERRSWRWVWIAIVASLSTLEFSGVLILALGSYWLLDSLRWREIGLWIRRKETWHAAMICVAGAAWSLLGIRVIFYFNPGLAAESHGTWGPVGASSIYQLPLAILLNPGGALAGLAWDWPFKALYLLLLFGPVLFLPFSRPLTLLMPAPWLLASLTGTRGTFYTIGNQYPAFVIPFVFYGAIRALERMRARRSASSRPRLFALRRWHLSPGGENQQLVVFGVVALAFLALGSPLGPIRSGNFETGGLPVFDAHVNAVWGAVDLVPRGASILAQNNLFPYFAERSTSYAVPVGTYFRPGNTFNSTLDSYLAKVDYVIVDAQTSLGEAESVLSRPIVRTDFGIAAWQDGAILLRRGGSAPPEVYRPVTATFDARGDLALLHGSVVEDRESKSGSVLLHHQGGNQDFWRGPKIYLWPGDYAVTFRLKASPVISGPLLTLGATVQPSFLVMQGEIPGEGHFTHVIWESGACNINLATLEVRGNDFGNATGYLDFTLSFRASVFGLYDFPGYAVTGQTDIYLDLIELTQLAPLGFHTILTCP